MRILLTNDDGIQADGLAALLKELKKIGQVDVVAPDSQRSSVGHGITLGRPLTANQGMTANGVRGIGLSGTPADCVKFALKVALKRKPDVVVSGINLGPNDGCSVFYSGTVAAAREASLNGIPAIAFSLNTFVDPDYKYAAQFAAGFTRKILGSSFPRGTFLSVNIPNLPKRQIKGVKFTRQGKSPLKTRFLKGRATGSKGGYWMTGDTPLNEKDVMIDTIALSKNFITVTPLQNDLTDYKALEALTQNEL